MVCNQIQVPYPIDEIDNSRIPYQLMKNDKKLTIYSRFQGETSGEGGAEGEAGQSSVSRGDSGHSDQSESSRSTLESSTNTPDTENHELPATPDVYVDFGTLACIIVLHFRLKQCYITVL